MKWHIDLNYLNYTPFFLWNRELLATFEWQKVQAHALDRPLAVAISVAFFAVLVAISKNEKPSKEGHVWDRAGRSNGVPRFENIKRLRASFI